VAASEEWTGGEPCSLILARLTTIKQWRLNVPRSGTTNLRIPMKVISDSDLIPVTCSEVKAVVFGAKRRWRSYRA
jgi:hypothetical protein